MIFLVIFGSLSIIFNILDLGILKVVFKISILLQRTILEALALYPSEPDALHPPGAGDGAG